jgi:hypothetical protein
MFPPVANHPSKVFGKIFSLHAPFLVRSRNIYDPRSLAPVLVETRRCSAYPLPREAQPFEWIEGMAEERIGGRREREREREREGADGVNPL